MTKHFIKAKQFLSRPYESKFRDDLEVKDRKSNAKERENENLSSTAEYAEGFKTPGTGFAYNPNAVATKAHKFV